jgi:Predicted integral membrane protein
MRKWVPAIIVVAAVVVSAVMYPQLPEKFPTHWNASGTVNGWSSRFLGAWMMPLILAGTWVIMRAIPQIDPRKENYAKFKGVYEAMIIAIMLVLFGIHITVLMAATGSDISLARVIPIGIGMLFFVMGTMLPRIEPNWFMGIRTPWTLSSNLSWERTHHVGGYVFMAIGALTIVASLLASAITFKVLFAAVMLGVAFLFFYSYRVWKEDPAKSAA